MSDEGKAGMRSQRMVGMRTEEGFIVAPFERVFPDHIEAPDCSCNFCRSRPTLAGLPLEITPEEEQEFSWEAPYETGLKEMDARIARNLAAADAYGLPYDRTEDDLERTRLRDAYHAANLARGWNTVGTIIFPGCSCDYCRMKPDYRGHP